MSAERLPPGPSLPAIAQTVLLLRPGFGYLRECAATYGDRFTVRMAGLGPIVHLSHPEDLKALFTADPEMAHAGEANYAVFGPLAGRGTMFTMDGQRHLRRRRVLLPPFHGERMQHYAGVMEEVTARVMARWPRGEPFTLHTEMQAIALEVILRAVFGLGDGAEARALAATLTRVANEAVSSPLLLLPFLHWDLGPWSPWGRVLQIVRDAHAAVDREIARRRTEPEDPAAPRQDVLSLLLSATDEDGQPLADEQLRDELLLLLLAGHETTATTLAWMFARLLKAPEVLARARAEVDAVVGDGPLAREHLTRLPYLDAVIKESMRLRPIMPTAGARRLYAPLEIRDYRIPPGVFVANSETLLHLRPDLYPDPDAFRPERFLGKKSDPYQWTPFGGGVRRCLGMAFALYEMKVVLATVLRGPPLALVGDADEPAMRGFFVAPRNGVRVIQV